MSDSIEIIYRSGIFSRDFITYLYVEETACLLLLSEGGLLICVDVSKRKTINWQIGIPIIPAIEILDPHQTRLIYNYSEDILTVILYSFKTHEIQRIKKDGRKSKCGKLTVTKSFEEEFLAVRVIDNIPSVPFKLTALSPILRRIKESLKFYKFDQFYRGRIAFFGNQIIYMYGLVPFYLGSGDEISLKNESIRAFERFLTRFGFEIQGKEKYKSFETDSFVENFQSIDCFDNDAFPTKKLGAGKTRDNFDRALGKVQKFKNLSHM